MFGKSTTMYAYIDKYITTLKTWNGTAPKMIRVVMPGERTQPHCVQKD